MFAHQVIEDLSETIHISTGYNDAIKLCMSLIRNSGHFHLGDIEEINGPFSVSNDSKLFIENAAYMKLPYKYCWFDMADRKNYISGVNGGVNKMGALAFNHPDHDDILQFYTFCHVMPRNKWLLIPLLFVFSFGEPFSEKNHKFLFPSSSLQIKTSTGEPSNMAILRLADVNPEEFFAVTRYILTAVEHGIVLLNCKNITSEKHSPDEALNKSRRKRGKQELFTYKTLKLLLPGNKEKHNLQNEPTGEHNRIHFCRGHFKEYTAEAPLFGRITGLWWWQPHVRGQNKDGIVVKDYEVEIIN